MQEEPESQSNLSEELCAAGASLPKQVVTSDEELKRLHNEAMEYKNKYLRLLAENENTKKRWEKERQEFAKRSKELIITDFLHPIDSLESALGFAKEMSEEVSNWALGFKMILTQLKDVLVNHGVVAIQSKGRLFDPHMHEAIEVVDSEEVPAGTILEEFVRGYRMGDRVIRPARVKVAKAKETFQETCCNEECTE